MQFLFPALAAGFLFVAVPPLVHLINMLRHRRQQWAAMEFLLASYRKQKKWILLRQLLLLLVRVAVATVLIALLAGWSGAAGWIDALGGKTTHHVVIIDDSFSMSDTSGGGSAYERALAAFDGLSRRLATAEGTHQITAIRASRAALVVRSGSDAADAAADISAAILGNDLRAVERIVATRPSPLDTDCSEAMKLAVELVRATPSGRTVFYLLSDFRERNWQNTDSAKESIAAIARLGAEIRFIDCALAPAPNLAVTALEPLPDVWVAGVPVVFQVTVRNHSPTPVRNVNLSVRLTQYGGATTGPNPVERLSGKSEALPAVLFEQIPPRSEQTKQFQVFLASSGTHAVEVELPEDSVAIDNRRASTLPLAEAAKVLIIDGDVEGKGAYHVASVLDPGGQVRTGAVPEVRPPTFLRNSSLDTLREYRAIYLLDLPEIDANSQATLTDYVAAGGGLLWFIGPRAVVSQYNALLQNRDTPLLPAPLTEVLAMDASGASSAPDLSLGESHPVIAPFVSLGDAALSLVRVQRSMGMDLEQAATSPLTRLLNRRDGEPFVLQHDVGRGRIITVLGSLDSNWMNWTGDPTFVVFMLRANAFLWSAMAPQTARRVDEPFVVSGSQDEYSRMANYLPAVEVAPRIPIEKPGETAGETLLSFELNPLEAAIEGSADLDAMLNPGISELWLTRLDGTPEARLSAANISGMEGDLAQTEQTKIRTALQPVPVSFSDASEVIASDETSGGNLMALVLFAVLGLLLASEQILAYYASYHPPMVGARQ